MKRLEILEDAEYDRYLIFMYGENGILTGVNYHHGIGDFDSSYLQDDPRLKGIYIKRMSEKNESDTKLQIIRESIEELQITTQDFSREYVIRDIIKKQMLIMAEKIFEETYARNIEMSDAEHEMIAMSQKALELIFNKIIENKHK